MTLAPQPRPSVETLNYLLSRYSNILARSLVRLNKYEGSCRKYYFSYQRGARVVGGLIRKFSLQFILGVFKRSRQFIMCLIIASINISSVSTHFVPSHVKEKWFQNSIQTMVDVKGLKILNPSYESSQFE